MTRDDLIEEIVARSAADPRVVGAFLSGSLGDGSADRLSDCDLVLAVDVDAHSAFVGALRQWVAGIFEPVLWRQLYPGVPLFHCISAEYLRLDVTVTVPDRLAGSRATWRSIYDPGRLFERLPADLPARALDAAKIAALVEEFWRILGLLPVGAGRGDDMVAASGVGLLRAGLIALMIEAHAPAVRPGALSLARVLDPDEIALVTGLPWPDPGREGVIGATFACAAAFLPKARALASEAGAVWPDALEAAARGYIRRELGLEVPG